MEQIKPNEIEKIVKENQFKYIELKGADGKKYGGFNQKPDLLKKKIDSIKQFCNTLPNGIYYLNFKISPVGDIFTYCYNKGNFLNENQIQNFQPIQQAPVVSQIEKLQTIVLLKKQTKVVSELVTRKAPDAEIMRAFQNLHDVFHRIVEMCQPGKK